MDQKIKHLEMIEAAIARMAGNSFSLKGWAVTLVAGIFALSSKEADKMYFLVAYVPIIVFWGLDSYYLKLERMYRNLYNSVRLKDENEIDFNMNARLPELQTAGTEYNKCLLSVTEMGFYLPLALLSTVIAIVTYHVM